MIKFTSMHGIVHIPAGYFNDIIISSVITMAVTFFLSRFSFLGSQVMKMICNSIAENYYSINHCRNEEHLSFLFCVFCFITGNNLIGIFLPLIPFTHNILLTALFSMLCFFYVILQGIKKKGWRLIKIFIPSNLPGPVIPFIFAMELLSFCCRPITLTLRLFMNIYIGHFLISFTEGLEQSPQVFIKVIAVFLSVMVHFMELFGALLQAYIFVLMLTNYINDVTGDSH